MLTQIRHIQKTTLIIVTIIIVIAFAFLYSDYDSVRGTVGKANCIVKVYDRCYRQKEAQKLATNYDVAMNLGMYEYAITMFNSRRKDRDPTDFIISLVTLRKEAERMGIEPTAQEIKEAIPKLPVFQDPRTDATYVKNILSGNGFTDGDLAQLVKDYLCFQKLKNLVTSGVQAIPSAGDKSYVRQNQRYEASVIHFDRKNYMDQVKITDEDIKKYYEDNKENLLSEEKRGFDFVKFIPANPPAKEPTNEQRALVREFANSVNRIYADLAEDGIDFAAVAKKHQEENKGNANLGMEIGKFEPFTAGDAPEALKADRSQLMSLFSGALQPGIVSVPFPQEDGSYYVFRFSEQILPQPLKLEEATEGIRTALKNKKSNQLVDDAAKAAKAKLQEALDAKKPIAEAAKAAGVELVKVPNFSESEPPAGIPDASLILEAVEGLGPNELSDEVAKPEGRGYLLAYVEKIQLYKDEEIDSKKRTILAQQEGEVKRTLFNAWLNRKRREAGGQRKGQAAASTQNAPFAPGSGPQ